MYYEATMTPLSPKTYFPVAEPEPPSTTNTTTSPHYPTDTSQSPHISIQFTSNQKVNILIKCQRHVDPPYPETLYTINITIKNPPPVRTVEPQSPLSPPLTPNLFVETTNQTPINTVEIQSSPTPHTILSAAATTFVPTNLNTPRFTPKRPRRPYNKRQALIRKVTPATNGTVENSNKSIVYSVSPPSRRKRNRVSYTDKSTPLLPTSVHPTVIQPIVPPTIPPLTNSSTYRDALSPLDYMTDVPPTLIQSLHLLP